MRTKRGIALPPEQMTRVVANLRLAPPDEAAFRDAAWRAHLMLGPAIREAVNEWTVRHTPATQASDVTNSESGPTSVPDNE